MTALSSADHLLLHALADQELDAAAALALEARVAAEPALAAEYARILALKARTKALGKPAVAPDFAARVVALASDTRPVSKPRRARILSLDHPSWQALAASVVLTALVASGGTYLFTAPQSEASIEDAVAN